MANPFAVAIRKIAAGAKFLGEKVWAGLKSVFGQNAKDISLAALQSAKELLKTEVGQFIHTVVVALEDSALSGPDRLSSATIQVKDYLKNNGKELSTVWVQWAIQTILAFVRGLAPQ
jgi:hypothetical protein